MLTVVIVIHLMIVLSLIAVVLLQKSEGGGLGMGGGGAGGFLSSRGTANVLTRTTAILAMGFFITSLLLSILAGLDRKPRSISHRLEAPRPRRRPAAPSTRVAAFSTRCGAASRRQRHPLPRAGGAAGSKVPVGWLKGRVSGPSVFAGLVIVLARGGRHGRRPLAGGVAGPTGGERPLTVKGLTAHGQRRMAAPETDGMMEKTLDIPGVALLSRSSNRRQQDRR